MFPLPPDWLACVDELAGTVALEVAGYRVPVTIAPEPLRRAYLPILAILNERARAGRVLTGLAGIPGSGKSTCAAVLAHLADRLLPSGAFVAAGIDGWHLPNAVLDRLTTRDDAGRVIPLRLRKGGPESFDVPALAAAIGRLLNPELTTRLPVYDRRVHEPVPDRLVVTPRTRIVLLEGNYLLEEEPPWKTVTSLLSPRFYLAADPDLARRRVIERHVRGGCTTAEADHKFEINDGLNTRIVLRNVGRADWTIALGPRPSLRTP